MITTTLITDVRYGAALQSQFTALQAQLTSAFNTLSQAQVQIQSLLAEVQTEAISNTSAATVDLLSTLQVAVNTQNARLALLYYNQTENIAALQYIQDSLGRYYCCAGNQAQSYLNHVRQSTQYAHRGILVLPAACPVPPNFFF